MRRPLQRRITECPIRAVEKSSDATRGRFDAYMTVWGVNNPWYDEETARGAYKKTLRDHGRVMTMNRDHGIQIGYFVDMKEDDTGLFVRGEINLETDDGREVWALTQQSFEVGKPMGLSREFFAIREEVNQKTGHRVILEEQLIGGAVTPYQSLPPAQVTGLREQLHAMGLQLSPEQEALLEASDVPADALLLAAADVAPITINWQPVLAELQRQELAVLQLRR